MAHPSNQLFWAIPSYLPVLCMRAASSGRPANRSRKKSDACSIQKLTGLDTQLALQPCCARLLRLVYPFLAETIMAPAHFLRPLARCKLEGDAGAKWVEDGWGWGCYPAQTAKSAPTEAALACNCDSPAGSKTLDSLKDMAALWFCGSEINIITTNGRTSPNYRPSPKTAETCHKKASKYWRVAIIATHACNQKPAPSTIYRV